MSDAKFKVGDLVIHRASRDKGVILHVGQKCINPNHATTAQMFVHQRGFTSECQLERTGYYTLSLDYERIIYDVPEILLEIPTIPLSETLDEALRVKSMTNSSADWLTDRELQDVIDFGAGGVDDISSDEAMRLIASELLLLRNRVKSYLDSTANIDTGRV